MSLADVLSEARSVFLDTAPVIYYIEAHSEFGPIVRQVIDQCRGGRLVAYSSVVTLAEVLPKPVEAGNERLARRFAEFLKYGRNIRLVDITEEIAEGAGRMRGRYRDLKTVDAIQISAAMSLGADAFITNDKRLRRVREIPVLVLSRFA